MLQNVNIYTNVIIAKTHSLSNFLIITKLGTCFFLLHGV